MKTRIGIRREDKNQWEKRAPLIPSHVKELVQNHPLEIWIQPSSIRIFSDEEYAKEGANIKENLSSCSIVFAVKEIPLQFIEKHKVYIFFSHTIKGQPYNMPMLRRLVELECTLIDYERIVDENGMRLLFFGKQAGQAGMIDTLWALGQRLKQTNQENFFSSIKQAYRYKSLVEAKEEIQKVAWKIHKNGFETSLAPLVCGFTGYGHVSQGAQEIFDILPVEQIEPGDLESFCQGKNHATNRVYKVVFKEEHMVKSLSKIYKFQLQDYYDNPNNYESIFESYVPFLTVLVNCIYWSLKYPRFVTKRFLKGLWKSDVSPRLKVIGDISCDVEGAVECTVRSTTPDNPVFIYDPIEEIATDGFDGQGVVVMAIDNLPAEISLESSNFFSGSFKSFVPDIAKVDYFRDFNECHLPPAIKKAVILYRGQFTPDYEYMKKYIKK